MTTGRINQVATSADDEGTTRGAGRKRRHGGWSLLRPASVEYDRRSTSSDRPGSRLESCELIARTSVITASHGTHTRHGEGAPTTDVVRT